MTLPPCPWCAGRREPKPGLTGWACSSCGRELGVQLEQLPARAVVLPVFLAPVDGGDVSCQGVERDDCHEAPAP